MEGKYYFYILASGRNGTLYIGITSSLICRVYEHKDDQLDGFTKKYGVHDLVYYEEYNNVNDAITRETQVKKWNREWKINLIKQLNPEWKDLYNELNPFG